MIGRPHVSSWLAKQETALLRTMAKAPGLAREYVQQIEAELAGRDRDRGPKGPVGALITLEWDAVNRILTFRPVLVSSNDLKRWLYSEKGKHQYARYRERLAGTMRTLPMRQPCWRKTVLTHWWRTVQARDEDSFGFSCKVAIDAMVDAGMLDSDAPDTLSVRFGGQMAGGKGARTECCTQFTLTKWDG